ncbi:FecCD family ABC transporter permease [Actinacidiphila acidipaludis]|uniref:Iron chelate uptake ABC transporter family permease subunit n=1 Tax=Actinacidiphila acidipaludis TaxID=2873382 RepID=A0ABS7Q7V1_9ACTN|nr:iron chelate uptake ABC transporter family permease subunit [Streptomyces acidipaludis]MBY8878520.1 iron chelate uptake ABC transporter family permease subunit [Streptomyces acidipaludis]
MTGTSRAPERAAVPAPAPIRAPRTRGGLSLRIDARAALVCAVLLLAALGVSVLLIGTGDFRIAPLDVLRTLTGQGTPAQEFIVRDLRLPRVVVALLVGAALGMAGAAFQSVSRNPLGSPDVIGFGQGSAAGALIVIVLLKGTAYQVAAGSVAGGLVTGLGVYLLAWKRGVQGYRLVLVGIGASAVLAAVKSYLLVRADFVDAARAVVWLTGSLDGRGWEQVWPLLGACAVLMPLLLWQGPALRLTEMGDDTARGLGVRVERVRLVTVLAAVLLTAFATAAAGPVGFIALTAPQLARRLTRSPGVGLLPSALMGSALLVGADLAAQRAFGSGQVPVGVATGVLGGGYLLWLLVTERRAGRI